MLLTIGVGQILVVLPGQIRQPVQRADQRSQMGRQAGCGIPVIAWSRVKSPAGPASQDQTKDQRAQISPDRARRPQTPNPL